jgi:hypothetical protein
VAKPSYRELGFSDRDAAHRARIAYAAYVGLLQMAREAPESGLKKGELERFVAELRRLLVDAS